MKKWLSFLTALTIVTMISCKKTEDYSEPLGGATDLGSNAVGYKYSGSLKIGGSGYATDAKAEVTKSEGGIVQIKATGTLPSKLKNLITSPYVNGNGAVDITGKFVNSTEGVAYVNASGEQSILVKYDAKVGDTWDYTTKGGKKLQRKVTAKSTTDDFPYAFFDIKVITVEQNLPYPGFTKAVYRANHKFGLVHVELFLEDGTSVAVTII
ncbi:MAG: hypothetical protein Q8P34_00540 [Bacteroidota bacterium]|nr:hypothetical protein [Bacteroidota bacterium]